MKEDLATLKVTLILILIKQMKKQLLKRTTYFIKKLWKLLTISPS